MISPLRNDLPCTPCLWKANTLSGKMTKIQENLINQKIENHKSLNYLPILSILKSKLICDINFLLCFGAPCKFTICMTLL